MLSIAVVGPTVRPSVTITARRERGRSAERPGGMADVLPAGLHPSSAGRRARRRQVQRPRDDLPEPAGELPRLVEIRQRRVVGGCRVCAPGDELPDAIVEMLCELFDDLRLALRLQTKRSQPFDQFAPPH